MDVKPYTVSQASQILDLNPNQVRGRLRTGQLRGVKVGSRWQVMLEGAGTEEVKAKGDPIKVVLRAIADNSHLSLGEVLEQLDNQGLSSLIYKIKVEDLIGLKPRRKTCQQQKKFKQSILAFLDQRGDWTSTEEIRNNFGRSSYTIWRKLSELLGENKIERKGNTRATRYRFVSY